MFKFLLRLLGIEKYEYPETDKPLVMNTGSNNQPSVKSQPEPEPEPEPERKPKSAPALKPAPKPAPEQANKDQASSSSLTVEMLMDEFPGLKINYAKMLIEMGFDNLEKINKASDSELVAIKGIGKATVKLLRKK